MITATVEDDATFAVRPLSHYSRLVTGGHLRSYSSRTGSPNSNASCRRSEVAQGSYA